MIVNLTESAPFASATDGNTVTLRVGADNSSGIANMSAQATRAAAESGDFSTGGPAITEIDFRRGKDGSGTISIDLSQPSVNVDIDRNSSQITLSFYQTTLPERLDRRLDVVDFATPVQTVDSKQEGSKTVVAIEASGQYDYLAYQADGQYVVNIKPLSDAEIAEQSKKFAFNGERLTLNFQNIEVRSVLQIIAEFTSLNLVASDTVTGSITLRLDNVPWDQALEIILKAKGLDKRQEGNVLMVAPSAEIAEQERLQVEANKQLQELAPLETAFV